MKQRYAQLDTDFALQATGFGVWALDTKISEVVWDDRCRELFGLAKDNLLPYEQAIKYIHPDDVERVNLAVLRATNPASDGQYDETYRTIGADDGKLRWVRFYGRAYFSEGELYRFGGIAHEVTNRLAHEERQTEVRERAQRQQRVLEAISANTPDLMYVIDLNYRFAYANKALLDMWGSTWENSIGKTLLENGYEPWHAEMHEREVDQVVATKKAIRGEVSFPHATLGRRIYDYVFSPVFDETGEVEAIAGTTRDVTDLINARQALEENKAALSNAIEVAELGTWSVNIRDNRVTLSSRVVVWFGLEESTIDIDTFLQNIGVDDRERIHNSLFDSKSHESHQRYDQTYSIINAKTGYRRIIHAIGRIYFDQQQQPLKIEGSAQDITADRALTLLLEQQVQQRTEELEQTNELLVRSNNNLQNFAYVASHDLQEPLRKIQQFGNLLATRQETMTEHELTYVERMQSAANHMSVLIRDLLDFASVSNQQETGELVHLNTVVTLVLNTLELPVAESKAQINVGELPDVYGNKSQLAQLFQNLLGNALKFHRPLIAPVIHITSRKVQVDALPDSVVPLRQAASYHQIDVADNGIGFDEKYLGRIFQVFQRLHGKQQFSGTGIGLAICERVAANHGGAITASSMPGQGATFSVFLPVSA